MRLWLAIRRYGNMRCVETMPRHDECVCTTGNRCDDMLQVVLPAKSGNGYTLVTEYTVECVACMTRLYVIKGDHWSPHLL